MMTSPPRENVTAMTHFSVTSLGVHGLNVASDVKLHAAVHATQLIGAEGGLDLSGSGTARPYGEVVGNGLVRFDGLAADTHVWGHFRV